MASHILICIELRISRVARLRYERLDWCRQLLVPDQKLQIKSVDDFFKSGKKWTGYHVNPNPKNWDPHAHEERPIQLAYESPFDCAVDVRLEQLHRIERE